MIKKRKKKNKKKKDKNMKKITISQNKSLKLLMIKELLMKI